MKNKTKNGYIIDVATSVVISIIVTVLMIIIFSLALNFFDISAGAIYPINQAIKFLGVFIGVFFGISNKSLGLLKGASTGGIGILLLFLLFSGLGGSVVFTFYTLLDMICGMIVGAVSGIFAVNLKKDKKK